MQVLNLASDSSSAMESQVREPACSLGAEGPSGCGVRMLGRGLPVLLHTLVGSSKTFQLHPGWSQVLAPAGLEVTLRESSIPFLRNLQVTED